MLVVGRLRHAISQTLVGGLRNGRGKMDFSTATHPDFSRGDAKDITDIADTSDCFLHHLAFNAPCLAVYDAYCGAGKESGN